MQELNELQAKITSFKGKKYVDGRGAKIVDWYGNHVFTYDYLFFKLNKVEELTTITDRWTTSGGVNETSTHYFIVENGTVHLVSEQTYNLVSKLVNKNKTIVKSAVPVETDLGERYKNLFNAFVY